MTHQLIIFTRYPEAGKAKTRLIPAIGPQGAADLHRQLTEQTLATARTFQQQHPLTITVAYTGGDEPLMRTWLGPDLNYQQQSQGNLGDRMADAFRVAFATGAGKVVIMGTDCPAVTVQHLTKAFQFLAEQDLVLGPAIDGGYYLIGLRTPMPELFQGISWSTEQVLAQTLTIGASLHLTMTLLPPLQDIDQPTDLALWEKNCPMIKKDWGVMNDPNDGDG
ncbi:hypothetical protein BST81_16505 [Leptolyngbya sp. 'hensonii']|uniref:TIGR04282 family arsenosugar biosynthesis glycosyltransferase n=1 Tax=Leptolyngbya sp. 'hensonii' TaxID=1922337 RepID=UPI00094F6FCF|nr:TIGR04282 family arsenosugar biosynthesis glycosyltransferase [Leptolyngbya sp. 'hensonii']OLP17396.1 hypothetical protein BST81_16505 [Leptolyngbya sp. 'hensonii']